MADDKTLMRDDAARLVREIAEKSRTAVAALTPAERRERLAAVEFARASTALEGFKPTPADIEHERRFVEGEIDLATYTNTPRARV